MLLIIFLIIFGYEVMRDGNNDNVAVITVYYSINGLFILMNILLLVKFVKVSWFFIDTLRVGHLFNTKIGKLLVILVILFVIIGLIRNFLVEEVIKVLNLTIMTDVEKGTGIYSKAMV